MLAIKQRDPAPSQEAGPRADSEALGFLARCPLGRAAGRVPAVGGSRGARVRPRVSTLGVGRLLDVVSPEVREPRGATLDTVSRGGPCRSDPKRGNRSNRDPCS